MLSERTYLIIGVIFLTFLALFFLRSRGFSFDAITVVVLTFTLIALGFYSYDTTRIADQTVENSIRPTILRVGDLVGWDSVVFEKHKDGLFYGSYINFIVLNHIAKDISGYFVYDGKRYELNFFVPGLSLPPSGYVSGYRGSQNFGWMRPSEGGTDRILSAYFDSGSFSKTDEKNGWCLIYSDISDNKYFTSESGETVYSQKVGKLEGEKVACIK